VAQLVATDEDEGQELRYSITDGNEEGYFQIGACSGILSVAQAGLDYETQPTDRELTILVEDNGNPRGSVTTLARVHTVNINESPYPDPSVPWSNFIIDENVPSGTSPSPAVAQFLDYDLQDVLHYRIKVNDKDGINNVDAFAIDPNNGTLSVAPLATIDFETKSQFRLVVEAVDAGGLMAEQEDSEPDVQMEIVDGNSNGDFSEVFTLQRVSTVEADLMVNQPDGLDFETKEAFTLSIRLTDLKDNSNIVMSVQIAVTNINEAPEVDDQVRYALENLTFPGTIMDPIAAYDVDNEKVTQTLFFSLTDSADGQFAIGPEDGILRSLKPLDYESQTQYTVVVQVTDNGKPPLSTDATVTINILNVNEPPTFLDQSVSIDENSVAGDKVNRNLDASDVDQGDTLTFAIVPGSSSYADWFVIDPSTGRLKVASLLSSVDPWASRLDFELRPTIDIRVSVTDSGMDGPQAYTAEATITIQMNDKE
ncbi:DCHS2, partial [Symbiodinium sp. KB8]